MRVALALAAALLAGPALAQNTAAPMPARENAYGVTTGSPLSSTAPAATRGSAMSTARLPAPDGSARPRARRAAPASAGGGDGLIDRTAPVTAPPPPR